ncbi:unnamed protein product, partial [Mesorhabditis belari]|uniref:cystathionine gamma-lyase n=1 Tax=Mesorhabditis belari TaxID=2138241 RepID=A0AAF3EP46_9BILA
MSSNHDHSLIGFGTIAVHAGQEPEKWDSNQVVAPISLSTTYKWERAGEKPNHTYSRSSNPTREALQQCLAALEKAKYATVYSSGVAAGMAALNLLQAGDHFVVDSGSYGGTLRYMKDICVGKHGLLSTVTDFLDYEHFAEEIKENTKLVFFETPTNPMLNIIDISKVVRIVKEKNPKILVVVDNTFASPYFQNPLSHGADIVVHSMSKYINGHSDVVMGAVMTNYPEIHQELRRIQNVGGSIPSPFDCWLALRGIKTLHLRMEKHAQNVKILAEYLEKHDGVEKLVCVALPSHPHFELNNRQASGAPGLISLFVKGGLEKATCFLNSLKIFTCAESLGGVESLAAHPSQMSHKELSREERERLGIKDHLVRLSVGIEDHRDLIADLEQAFKKVQEL